MSSPTISAMADLLIPLDGNEASKRAVPVGGRLAERLGLNVRLFTVSADPVAAASKLRATADRYLADHDVAIDAAPAGDPVDAIVAAAGETGLVCMATAGSLLPHQGHVGSVAEGVVRQIGRPVALVGPKMVPHPGESTKRVIIPVDGSDLAEASLEIAGDLAKTMQVPLWVVTVASAAMEHAAEVEMGAELVAGESGYVRHLAERLAKAFDISVEFEVLHIEDPAQAIVDFAGDDGTVVMTTHGRSGLSRLFAGSVATGVVAHSQRAVVVWRPDAA